MSIVEETLLVISSTISSVVQNESSLNDLLDIAIELVRKAPECKLKDLAIYKKLAT